MTETEVEVPLDAQNVRLLHEVARGLSNPQIAVLWGLTTGQVNIMLKQLYKLLGVHDLGQQSRAYALAIAARRYGLEPPEELEAAVALMQSDDFEFGEADDPAILKLVAEGNNITEIADQLRMRPATVRTRLAEMRLRTELRLYPAFCVAVAAIWAGKLRGLELDREYVPDADDLALVLDIILERTLDETAARLRVSRSTAKYHFRALLFRMGLVSEEELVDRCVRNGWFKMPTWDERITGAVDVLSLDRLSALELVVVGLLGLGHDRTTIKKILAKELGDSGLNELLGLGIVQNIIQTKPVGDLVAEMQAEYAATSVDQLLRRLYGRTDIHDAAALIAVVHWAGEPLAEPAGPGPAFTAIEIKQLVGLARGLTGVEIAHTLGISPDASSNRLGDLYRKLGASSAQQAVALAARDGLLDAWFETIDLRQVTASMFSPLYMRLLTLIANGFTRKSATPRLGVSSLHTLGRWVANDDQRIASLGLPPNTVIAVLVRRDEIEVTGPPVIPQAAAAPGEAVRVTTVVARAAQFVAGNRFNEQVMTGEAALSKPLADQLRGNFAECVEAIRDRTLPRPWWHSRYNLSETVVDVTLFLQALANGQPLPDYRLEHTEYIEQEFIWWYEADVCAPLGASGPRQAVCIALWLGLIE